MSESSSSALVEAPHVGRVGRRIVIRGGLLASASLASAALFGCRSSAVDRPAASGGAGAGASTKQKLLNEDLLALNDQKLPYPFVIAEPDTAPKRGGDYREAGQKDLAPLDPILSTSTTTLMVPNTVGDRLLDFTNAARKNPYRNEIEGDLALSWELSPDGLTYSFHVTDKAKWHNKPPVNGRAFTADDIRAVYNRNATAANSVSKGYFDNMASVTAPNATTLVIKLRSPQPDFLVPLASRDMVIYPMELIDNGALANTRDAIGTGAYIATELVKGSHSKFVRNPDYWKPGKPYIDTIEVKTTPDSNARLAAGTDPKRSAGLRGPCDRGALRLRGEPLEARCARWRGGEGRRAEAETAERRPAGDQRSEEPVPVHIV